MPGSTDQDVFSFLAEWFDPLPQLTKQFLLKYFVETNEVEMVELKTRRLFLKRSPCPEHFSPREFALRSKVILHGRDLIIVSYADKPTEAALAPEMERTAFLLGPDTYSTAAGKILDKMITATGGMLAKLKTVRLDPELAKEVVQYLGVPGQDAGQASRELSTGNVVLFGVMIGSNAGALANKDWVTNKGGEIKSGETPWKVLIAESRKSTEELERIFAPGGQAARRTCSSTATFDKCTCCVIKPHAVKAGHVGKILDRIVTEGYEVSAMELFTLNRTQALEFLEVYRGVIANFEEMINEMITGPCVALEVRGDNVVTAFRNTAGPWDIDMAKELRPQSIRGMFGQSGARTGVHCTDLPDDGPSESRYFFELMQSA